MKSKKNIWSYIKNYKLNSLFLRTLLLIFLLLAVPFAALSAVFYGNIINTINEEIALENSSMLDASKNISDSLINECDLLSSYIANNTNSQLFMLDTFRSDNLGDLTQLTKTIPLIYKYIDSVYIYAEQSGDIFVGENKTPLIENTDNGWLDTYYAVNDRKGLISARAKCDSYPLLITIVKPIYVADEKKGAVVMNINSRSLYSAVMSDKNTNGQELLLLDEQNRILMSGSSDLFNTVPDNSIFDTSGTRSMGNNSFIRNIGGEKSVISYTESSIFDFTYISVLSMTLYESKLSLMNKQIAAVMITLFLLGLILAYIITATSYSPINEIISFLDKSSPAAGSADGGNKNELIYIINSIEHHIEDKEKMQEMLEERMKLLQQSQYVMLQAQINPHFLYNTLETINWMAYDLSGSENQVSKALLNLAGFFRNTMSASEYLVPIKTEISYTKDYINILELRYDSLFKVVWNIDESILQYTVIKICLQPIIENAVYHGLKPKGSEGTLTISAQRHDNDIVFTVSDDGMGMSNAEADELNTRMCNETYLESRHIGLVNVNRRIKIIFGNNYGIRVSSIYGKGTSVYVTLPAIIWENDSPKAPPWL